MTWWSTLPHRIGLAAEGVFRKGIARGRAVALRYRGHAVYLGLMSLAAALTFAKQLLLGARLSREGFGTYAYVLLLLTYFVPVASVGMFDSLGRSLPLLLGQRREPEAVALRNQVLTSFLFTTLILTLAAITVGPLVWPSLPSYGRLAIVGAETYALGSMLILLRDVRSRLFLKLFAGLMALRSLLDVIFVVGLGARYGVNGVLIAEVSVLLVVCVMAGRFLPTLRPSLPELPKMWALSKEGLQIVGANLLARMSVTGEQLVLGSLLAKSEFAVYSAHVLLANILATLGNMVAQYVAPRLLYLYGETGRDEAVYEMARGFMSKLNALGALGLPFAVAGYWIVAKHVFGDAIRGEVLFVVYCAAVLDSTNLWTHVAVCRQRYRPLWVVQASIAAGVIGSAYVASSYSHAPLPFAVILLVGRIANVTGTRWAATSGPSGSSSVHP